MEVTQKDSLQEIPTNVSTENQNGTNFPYHPPYSYDMKEAENF